MNTPDYTIKGEVATSEKDISLEVNLDPDDTEVFTLRLENLPGDYEPLAKLDHLEVYLSFPQCLELKQYLDKHVAQVKRDKRKVKIQPRIK